MKSRLLLALATGLFIAADDVKKDASKDDQAAMQGNWTATSGEIQGQKVTDEAIKVFKIVVKGNKITFTGTPGSTFELDATKKPRVIAVTPLDGPRKGKTQRAIYSIDKDTLKLCMSNDRTKDNQPPPKEFATKPGDGLTLITFKRDPAEKDK